MSKKGKALEQLVKSIEEQIKENPSLRVRSNVKIPNSNGILREFDVVVDNTSADKVVATGSDISDHTPVTSLIRRMRAGRITVAVKAGWEKGTLKVYATADGLCDGVLTVEI